MTMKKHLCILGIVFASLLTAFINGCERIPDSVVDMVPDSPPPTEPVVPPMQTGTDQSFTFSGSLDHQSPTHAVAFSPDGQTLASLGEESLKLWDPHTRQLKGTISLDVPRELRWIIYDPDGDDLAVGGPDDLPDYVTGHTSLVRGIAYSPDWLILASASSDKTVRVWDTLTNDHKYTLELAGQVWAVAFNPDGQTLATGGGFEGIHLWDAGTGQPKGILKANTGQVEGIAFGPRGQMLAVATGLGSGEAIHVWDLRTNELKETLMAEGYTVRKVAISPDGQLIAGGAYHGEAPGVLLWKRE